MCMLFQSTRNEGKFLSEQKYECFIFTDTDATSQATLQHNSAPAPPISTSVLAAPDHWFNIVLLGLTGTGKSSSANTILNTGSSKQDITPFRSEASSIPVTSHCEFRFMTKPFGIPVRLVDTPDFFHEDLSDPEAHIEECRKYCQRGQCVVLLVLQLGRFTDGERGILLKLEKRLGWKIREETVLLLTHGDDLRGDLVKHVETHPQLKSIAEMCSFRCHVFNNKILDNKQVTELVKKIPNYKKRFPKIARKEEGGCQLS
ncbi:immune-associated nucleotide-binding protein 9-like [Hippoglossus hippoglossus]|uniref:immune-associated nucleotide-binding protein 9-like n=1 Tax=Hippoglossus hippoglossus TaxID=8267 RepID=UPI00148E51FD|nr:immune-associated nucleotide-binding protein 9-like [Hippoglossus hippoglossus]